MKRFAFYGRVSTEDQQDPGASRGWQLARARSLIEPHSGEIVIEFFDQGQSRSKPWQRRPQGSALLAALRNPQRGFDAIVVGELARAFGDNVDQTLVLRELEHYGVELWHPDAAGRHDRMNVGHRITAALRAELAQEERETIRRRVRLAMNDQAAREGRYLGGRPPYGYRLADAGPHPNPGKAAAGQRLHRLEIDDIAAPIVRRIFAEYIAGAGLYAIAEGLTRDGVPSPAAHDRARNRHRTGRAWSKPAIRAILRNPRYTGRQVWNRQPRHEVLVDVDDTARGYKPVQRWNDPSQWVWSAEETHEALVSAADFARVQEQMAAGRNRPASRKAHKSPHPYILRGLLTCGVCGRRMSGSLTRQEPRYRCRYGVEYAYANDIEHPRNVYVREDVIVDALDGWLARLFDPEHLDDTLAELVAATAPLHVDLAAADAAQRQLVDCDTRLAKYRSALEHGADPTIVASWIAEVKGERLAAERAIIATRPQPALTTEELRLLIAELGDMRSVLATADPTLKSEVYGDVLGLRMIYRPAANVLAVSASPWAKGCVGGGT
jgi:site-specific DNA recombinase